ncbi:EF-Hand 1, calcium-binding site [Sesbania bispinosa]|nr:EF-Hand 1, calcium-binding site [Sesbania bispinosa]KAJ1396923.1 EF-Hand 1, calcium-binding site [Sesbania bispinosa]
MAFMDCCYASNEGKRVMTLQQFKQWVKTSFDTNRDGRISKAELREAIRLTGFLFASWKSNKVLKSADTDHDGFIDEKEFINLAQFAEKHLNVRITK